MKQVTIRYHRCTQCEKVFKSGADFDAHECVTELQSLSLEELKRRATEK